MDIGRLNYRHQWVACLNRAAVTYTAVCVDEDLRQWQLIIMTTRKGAFKRKNVLEIVNHTLAVKFKWNLHRQCSLQSTS
jgi:hypothetical protein